MASIFVVMVVDDVLAATATSNAATTGIKARLEQNLPRTDRQLGRQRWPHQAGRS
jgi:hypothetical protein